MSPLSRDPEHLRVPAFMRRRELANRDRKKLQMTALDRSEAGLLPEGVSKKTAKQTPSWRAPNLYDVPATRANTPTEALPSMRQQATTHRPGNMWEIAIANIHKEKHPEARIVPALKPRASRVKKNEPEIFEEPVTMPTKQYRTDRQTRMSHDLKRAPKEQGPQTQALKAVGEITQFFEKISVAVLRLDDALAVGDAITYQTTTGSHTQTVLSMEIDRTPIFKAKAGDEIGIKLYKTALVGKVVYAQEG